MQGQTAVSGQLHTRTHLISWLPSLGLVGFWELCGLYRPAFSFIATSTYKPSRLFFLFCFVFFCFVLQYTSYSISALFSSAELVIELPVFKIAPRKVCSTRLAGSRVCPKHGVRSIQRNVCAQLKVDFLVLTGHHKCWSNQLVQKKTS